MKSLIAAALDERERLEGLGTRAQESNRFWIAEPGEHVTARVDDCRCPEVNGFDDASPGHRKERLVRISHEEHPFGLR
jgi:hypothetical protein